jgi:hypothetical protein
MNRQFFVSRRKSLLLLFGSLFTVLALTNPSRPAHAAAICQPEIGETTASVIIPMLPKRILCA